MKNVLGRPQKNRIPIATRRLLLLEYKVFTPILIDCLSASLVSYFTRYKVCRQITQWLICNKLFLHSAMTHHQNQGPQTLSEALLEERLSGVEDLRQLLQNLRLCPHHDERVRTWQREPGAVDGDGDGDVLLDWLRKGLVSVSGAKEKGLDLSITLVWLCLHPSCCVYRR